MYDETVKRGVCGQPLTYPSVTLCKSCDILSAHKSLTFFKIHTFTFPLVMAAMTQL
jgi:hypothetical protein